MLLGTRHGNDSCEIGGRVAEAHPRQSFDLCVNEYLIPKRTARFETDPLNVNSRFEWTAAVTVGSGSDAGVPAPACAGS